MSLPPSPGVCGISASCLPPDLLFSPSPQQFLLAIFLNCFSSAALVFLTGREREVENSSARVSNHQYLRHGLHDREYLHYHHGGCHWRCAVWFRYCFDVCHVSWRQFFFSQPFPLIAVPLILLLTGLYSLGTQQYKCFFNQGDIKDGSCSGPDSDNQGGISASMPGGSFIGALCSGILTDMFGRRRAIQVGAVIWCIGSAITCASFSIGQLVAGRFICGFSVGICSAQVPVYVAELA